ncbi:MAG: helix-turn-helix transcriptional regulator [Akkermansiaceae bacterium]
MSDSKPRNVSLTDHREFGGRTKVAVVAAAAEPSRDWLAKSPVCSLLENYQIAHTGVMHGEAPLRIVRKELSGTFMLACFEGEGEILTDGRWKPLKAGQACIQPPFLANALKCVPGKKWSFCWVRYIENREVTPIFTDRTPVMGDYDPEPLRHAVLGLIAESKRKETTPVLQHHWVELLQQHVLRFAQPHREDDRLWKMWKAVEEDLSKQWSLPELAARACLSEEHLRRLCKQQYGRSPIQHLTFLRMQHASSLLANTETKIDLVAREVGYAGGFHFSNVFTKWVGWRPSEYRNLRPGTSQEGDS